MVGEQQHGGFVLLQTLPEVVGIGFGDAPALAIEPWRNRRELSRPLGEEGAIAFP